MNFQEYINTNRKEIENYLSKYNIKAGKLIRPNITLLVCDLLNGDRKKALELGCAIEIAHYTSLIVDDFIDQDKERRGSTALWVISASKMLLNVLHNISQPYDIVSKYGRRYIEEIANTHRKMVEGVAKELFSNLPASALYDIIITQKTGALFALSSKFGAMSSSYENNDSVVELWGEWGLHLGKVFQIADDIGDIKDIIEKRKKPTNLSTEFILLKCVTIDHTIKEMAASYILSGKLDLKYLKKIFDNEQTQKALKTKLNSEITKTNSILKKIKEKCKINDNYLPIIEKLPNELAKLKIEEVG